MARCGVLSTRLRRAALYPLLTMVVVLASCSSDSPHAAGTVVRVVEKDFEISGPTRLASGDVVLSVDNEGPDDHELIVVRADSPTLQLRADGVTIDEEALEPTTVGALEPGAPNSVRQLSVHLTPGHYTMFCNMAGHYLGGMRADLEVT